MSHAKPPRVRNWTAGIPLEVAQFRQRFSIIHWLCRASMRTTDVRSRKPADRLNFRSRSYRVATHQLHAVPDETFFNSHPPISTSSENGLRNCAVWKFEKSNRPGKDVLEISQDITRFIHFFSFLRNVMS